MNASDNSSNIERNVEFIHECTVHRPRWAVILGTGLAAVADRLERRVVFPYESLHGMPPPTVKGHAGQLVIGLLGGATVAVFQGRLHVYEGLSVEQTLVTVRLAASIGARNLIITNAVGGLNPAMSAGDLMVVSDHINLLPSEPEGAPAAPRREVKKHEPVYDFELGGYFACRTAFIVKCHRGVYAGLSGPAYETPAEAGYLRRIGADAVGMSTVHESVEARRLGMRVLAVSCISNLIGAGGGEGPDHDSVLEAASRSAAKLADVLENFIPTLENPAPASH